MTRQFDPPARVLLTIPNFVTAGSGRALVNLAERLDRNRIEPVVAVARKTGAPLERRLESKDIEVLELDLRIPARPYASLGPRAWRAGNNLRSKSISIVHSFDYGDTYTEALTTHMGGAHYISTKKNMGWGSRAWHLRSLLSDRIAVQNEEMFRQFFAGRLLRNRCRYVPRGVVTADFRPTTNASDASDARRLFGLPSGAVVVGCVASICRRKNQELLVRALPDDGSCYLLIAGPVLEADYEANLGDIAARRGISNRVVFAGELADVRPALWASNMFALASTAEGSPVALLEAMSAELPVLATAIPGVSELLSGSDCAVLIDPDDVDSAHAALLGLCANEPRRLAMGVAAGELVASRRSIDLEVARTESMYSELLWTRGRKSVSG